MSDRSAEAKTLSSAAFANSSRRGEHWIGNPGFDGRGALRQGYLEDSNVDAKQELESLQKLQEQAHVLEQAACLLKTTNGPISDRTKLLAPIAPIETKLKDVLRAAQQASAEARQIAIANLVNATTPSYKRQTVSLATALAGAPHADGNGDNKKAIASSNFVGAALASPDSDMRPGSICKTGRSLDLGIEGEGYFCVAPSDQAGPQDIYYTRCGQFVLDRRLQAAASASAMGVDDFVFG